MPRQELCLGRKFSLIPCDEWLPQSLLYLDFRSLSGAFLQLVQCLMDSALVAGSAVLQMFPPSLQLVFLTGKYITSCIVDGPVCVFVLSC